MKINNNNNNPLGSVSRPSVAVATKTKVSPLTSNAGRDIANKMEIEVGNVRYFQSYDSVIVKVANGDVELDHDTWDYSRTTSKHRNQFLGENTKTVQAKVKSGEYKLVDLNNGSAPTVESMISANGNTVPNQYIIKLNGEETFQSYQTIIARTDNGQIILDGEVSASGQVNLKATEYSRTTNRYLYDFLRGHFFGADVNKEWVKAKIADGTLGVADLNK